MTKLNSSINPSLPMINVAKEAIIFIRDNHKRIVNSIKYPCSLTILISLFVNREQETIGLYWVVSAIIQTYCNILIVVRLHRLFLLNETEYSFKDSFSWKSQNTSYLLTTIAIGLMAFFITMPLALLFISITSDYEFNSIRFMPFIFIPLGYVLSRLSLVFPSIAINDKINFRKSWNLSKGNGWKVFILVTLIPTLFTLGIDFLYYDNIALRPLYSLLGISALSIEVIILSNTYKKLALDNIL